MIASLAETQKTRRKKARSEESSEEREIRKGDDGEKKRRREEKRRNQKTARGFACCGDAVLSTEEEKGRSVRELELQGIGQSRYTICYLASGRANVISMQLFVCFKSLPSRKRSRKVVRRGQRYLHPQLSQVPPRRCALPPWGLYPVLPGLGTFYRRPWALGRANQRVVPIISRDYHYPDSKGQKRDEKVRVHRSVL